MLCEIMTHLEIEGENRQWKRGDIKREGTGKKNERQTEGTEINNK